MLSIEDLNQRKRIALDPTLRTSTISELKRIVPTLSPRLKTVAKYIVDHSSDFGLDPIRETARKCGVSTYTLVRMAKHMGFESYEAFREPFRHALVSSTAVMDRPGWIDELRGLGELGVVQADSAANSLAIVQRSLERQTTQKLEHVAKVLLEARHVYLTAVRASYAMAYYLHYVGRMALPTLLLIPRHMNSAIDELNHAGPGDVLIAITITPYSRETIEACKFAKARGVKLIIISDSDVISSEFESEETLVASVISTHRFGCFSGVMAIIETLLAILMYLGGKPAMERIKSYENLRIENNAYWIAQKKH